MNLKETQTTVLGHFVAWPESLFFSVSGPSWFQIELTSLSGPVDPSFRALSGRLNFVVRRHKFNKDCLLFQELAGRRLGSNARGRNLLDLPR